MTMQEQEDMRQTLKAASDMLFELSSSQSPKNYSSLYADVFTHLQQLPVRRSFPFPRRPSHADP
jgi:hypothetical protein